MEIYNNPHLDTNNFNFASKNKKEAARNFESLYLQVSLKEMRHKSEGGLFNSGLAEEVFNQFMDEAIATEISKSSQGLGLADAIIKEMPSP